MQAAKALPSTKSGLFQPFKHLIPRLLCAELSSERTGVEKWPYTRNDSTFALGILFSV